MPGTRRHPVSNDAGRPGERRQLWARDTRQADDSPLVYIEPGGAAALRPACRAGWLICPVPNCESPRYTTRGGSKRDSFAHLRVPQDPNHTPERWFHMLAKQQIGEWLRLQAPDADVHIDHHAVDNGQIPDVLVRFPDGRRFAFEVQFSPITADAWLRRHNGYVEQSVTDVWLFGHIPSHLRRRDPQSDDAEPWFVLTALHQEVRVQSSVVRWIDPDNRLVYSLQRDADRRAAWDARYTNPSFKVEIDPLMDCRIEGMRFITPSDRRFEQDEYQRQQEAALREAELKARRNAQQRMAKENADRQRAVEDWRRKRDAKRATEWERFAPRLVERFGCVPPIIEESCHLEWSYWGKYPPMFRCSLFLEFIQGKVGSVFTFKQALARLADQPEKNMPGLRASLSGYLRRLRSEGFLSFDQDGGWIGHIRVRADLPEHRSETYSTERSAPHIGADVGTPRDIPRSILSDAQASIEEAARRCGLGTRVIRQPDGGAMRCLVGSAGQLRFVFEVLIDGPLSNEEMRRRSEIARGRQARAVWIALHANLADSSVETPCFPLRPHGAPDIEVCGGSVPLEDAVVQLITAPDRIVGLFVRGHDSTEA